MQNKNYTPPDLIKMKKARLCFSIILAFSLAGVLLFIPVTAGTKITVSVPSLPQFEPATGRLAFHPQAIDLTLPFGAALVQATGGLTITKVAPAFVNQGETITYTLTVINDTGQDLTSGLINDPVPANTVCGPSHIEPNSPPDPRWGFDNCDFGTAGWFMFYFPPIFPISFTNGTSNQFVFTAVVDQPLPDQFPIVNSNYNITADSFSDTGAPVTTLVNAPNWAITKTVSSETVQPGQVLTYTIRVTNDGHLATSGVYTITDPLPANTIPGSVSIQSPGFLDTGNIVTWVTSNPIPVSGSQTFTYSVRVTTPLTNGETIVNENYTVTGGNVFSPATGSPVTVTVASSATLVITKTASPDPVQAGDLLTYTITVTNDPASQGPAFGVTLTDTLPGEVIYQSAGFVSPASGTLDDSSDPTILWSLADQLDVGQSAQVTVTVRVTSPLRPGPITNTFAAAASNAAPVSATLTTQISATNEITLSKEVAPATVAPGDTVTYTITLTNSGNGIATVALEDLLPPGFTPANFNVSDIELPGRTLQTTEGITTVVFAATASITPGLYFNQVVTATYDLTQTTITAVAPVRVVSATLDITKIPNVSVANIGDTITYTYHITNSGDITVTNIVLSDDPLGPVTVLATTLGPAESTTGTAATLVAEGDLPGPIVNTATVTATYLSNNVVTATTTASVSITFTAEITVEKSFAASAGVPASIGDTITYTYQITNTGTITLYNAEFLDDKLGSLPISALPLGPGDTTTVTSTTTVVATDLPGPLVNTVIVTGTGVISSITDVATDTASVPLTYTVGITIDKTADPTSATVGDSVTYTYQITNTGQVTLTNIILYDDELDTNPPISITLAPGQSATGVAIKLITQGDLPGPVVNTATVTATDIFSAETVVASDTATVTLTSTTAISLTKTANVSVATIGQNITYSYRITNTGNVNLNNITLIDDKTGLVVSGLSLPPGIGTTVTDNYLVTQSDFPSPLVNTVVVTGVNFAGDTITSTAIATVTLVYTPGIVLDKRANVSTVAPGQTVTYTYHITNSGNVTLTNIVLNDNPLGAITPAATTLGPGSATTGVATYTVLVSDFPAITNTAIVTGDDILGQPITATDILVVNVQEPLLAITVTNSSPTPVNSSTFFTATTNLASGVTYTWNFVDGTTPAALGPNPNHVYTTVGVYTVVVTASNAINAITGTTVVTITPGPVDHFVLSAITPQTAGVPFTITIIAEDAFGNQVTSFNGPVDLSDDTGTITPLSVNLVGGVAIANVTVFSATSPAFDTITATHPVTPSIDGTVDVEILPDVPANLTVVVAPTPLRVCQTATVTATLTDQWNNPTPGQEVGLDVIPGPAPNGAANLSVIVGTTNSAGVINSILQATGAGNVRILGEHPVGGLITNSPLPVVQIITPAIPSAITVTVTPPSVLVNGTATVSAEVEDCLGAPVNGAVVTFTIASLGVINPINATTNASGIATTTVTAGAVPGVTTISGTIAGPLVDSTPFTITTPPVLTITKTATPPAGDVENGDTIIYELVVSNNGGSPASNIVITDVLDSGVGYVSSAIAPTGSNLFSGGVVTFSVPSLASGASVTATIEVTVTAATSGTAIVNSATASSGETGNIGSSNTVTHQVVTRTVIPGDIFLPILMRGTTDIADLTIVGFSISPPNPTSSGDNIVVTVMVQNQGTISTGEGFWVDFYVNPATLPNNPSLGADRRWDNPAIASSQGMAWQVPALGPGQSVILTSDGSGGGLPPSAPQTVWDGTLPIGNYTFYAFADSYDNNDPTGPTNVEIIEGNENNNMSPPISVTINSGLSAESNEAENPLRLPPRPDIGR